MPFAPKRGLISASHSTAARLDWKRSMSPSSRTSKLGHVHHFGPLVCARHASLFPTRSFAEFLKSMETNRTGSPPSSSRKRCIPNVEAAVNDECKRQVQLEPLYGTGEGGHGSEPPPRWESRWAACDLNRVRIVSKDRRMLTTHKLGMQVMDCFFYTRRKLRCAGACVS